MVLLWRKTFRWSRLKEMFLFLKYAKDLFSKFKTFWTFLFIVTTAAILLWQWSYRLLAVAIIGQYVCSKVTNPKAWRAWKSKKKLFPLGLSHVRASPRSCVCTYRLWRIRFPDGKSEEKTRGERDSPESCVEQAPLQQPPNHGATWALSSATRSYIRGDKGDAGAHGPDRQLTGRRGRTGRRVRRTGDAERQWQRRGKQRRSDLPWESVSRRSIQKPL